MIPPFAVNNPVEVNVPAPVRFAPLAVNAVVPSGAKIIFPVVPLPNVKVCAFVVPSTPAPVKNVALFPKFAETDAVGVPPELLIKANFAEADEFPPTNISRVEMVGYTAPFVISHQLTPPAQVI